MDQGFWSYNHGHNRGIMRKYHDHACNTKGINNLCQMRLMSWVGYCVQRLGYGLTRLRTRPSEGCMTIEWWWWLLEIDGWEVRGASPPVTSTTEGEGLAKTFTVGWMCNVGWSISQRGSSLWHQCREARPSPTIDHCWMEVNHGIGPIVT